MFQDGSDHSSCSHDPGTLSTRGCREWRSLDPGPAGQLPCPRAVARLLAGPETIVLPGSSHEARSGAPEWYACFQRFHVLFHFLFKVLFIFPSRYLFAIGLPQIFSFRRTLPPDWRCSPKQHDSQVGAQAKVRSDVTGLLPSPARYLNTELHRTQPPGPTPRLQSDRGARQVFKLSWSRFTRRY